jgi:protein-S-isoprenylcysteine O-methyltransferase Ste14
MSAAAEDNAGVRFPPPLVYILGMLGGSLLHSWIGRDTEPAAWRMPLLVTGVALAALGVVTLVSGAVTFRRAKTAVPPFRPASTFVTWGPYRFTRNPMYVGFAIAYVGFALWLDVLWALVFLPLVIWIIDRGVIAKEEAYLKRRFGSEYEAYCGRVGRWLGRR